MAPMSPLAPMAPLAPLTPRGANSTTKARLWRLEDGGVEPRDDERDRRAAGDPAAVEHGRADGGGHHAHAGADAELALGFLYGEGVVGRREEIAGIARPAVVREPAADSYRSGGGGLRIAPSAADPAAPAA